MKIAIALCMVLAAAQAVSFFEVVVEEWEVWKLMHGKQYTNTEEEKFRMKIYLENAAMIHKHNHQAMKGKHTYFLKMNHYGDMLHTEFVQKMNGFRNDLRLAKKNEVRTSALFLAPENVDLPDEIDWREKGYVTDVKNQGHCGSCWAFSTTGSLEGQHFRKTGNLTSLSEQNLVDCSGAYGNQGCHGGLMDQAFKYIKENGGIDTEESYPYDGEDETCQYNKKGKGAWDVGFTDIPEGDEKALQQAVGTVGPVSIAIDAAHKGFMFYHHGVYSDPLCDPQNLDHGVLIVGYGVDKQADNAEYWLVKNSWGPNWGDDGYIKMARNQNNMCGVASAASYPLV